MFREIFEFIQEKIKTNGPALEIDVEEHTPSGAYMAPNSFFYYYFY